MRSKMLNMGTTMVSKATEALGLNRRIFQKQSELAKLQDIANIAKKRKIHIQNAWDARKLNRELGCIKISDLTPKNLKDYENFQYTSFSDTLNDVERGLLKDYHRMFRFA